MQRKSESARICVFTCSTTESKNTLKAALAEATIRAHLDIADPIICRETFTSVLRRPPKDTYRAARKCILSLMEQDTFARWRVEWKRAQAVAATAGEKSKKAKK